jgi:DNA-directed RNA polymerase I subunit RPA1
VQLAKYVAKFRLLERGLLDAAHGVDDLQIRVSLKKSKSVTKKRPKNKKGADSDSDESSDDAKEEDKRTAMPDETVEQFTQRVNLYVAIHLARSADSKRDHYKDGLVFKARKDLINEFLKVSFTGKCQNEGCARYVFRI